MSEEEANSSFKDELGKCSCDKRLLLLMNGWHVCGKIWADTVRRLLGVVRGDRKRITKVLEREKEKDRFNCCSDNTTSHLYLPSVLGQGQLQWLQRKKLGWSDGLHFA